MSKAKDVLKLIKDEEIEWVDLRFHRSQGQVAAPHHGRQRHGRRRA